MRHPGTQRIRRRNGRSLCAECICAGVAFCRVWGTTTRGWGSRSHFIGKSKPQTTRFAKRTEIEVRLRAARSPFPRAESFGVHELIDPRETRPTLCQWIDWIQPQLDELKGPVKFLDETIISCYGSIDFEYCRDPSSLGALLWLIIGPRLKPKRRTRAKRSAQRALLHGHGVCDHIPSW